MKVHINTKILSKVIKFQKVLADTIKLQCPQSQIKQTVVRAFKGGSPWKYIAFRPRVFLKDSVITLQPLEVQVCAFSSQKALFSGCVDLVSNRAVLTWPGINSMAIPS